MKKEFFSKNSEWIGTIYHGDCLEILKSLNQTIEVCVTSPPYNLNKKGSTIQTNTKTSKIMTENFNRWYFDEMPELKYQEWQQKVIRLLTQVCISSIFYNHKIRYAWHPRNLYKTKNRIYHPIHWLSEFNIWCEIIWDRCKIGNPTNRYHNQTEKIYQINKPRKWNNKLRLTNVWRIPPSTNDFHVCSFPEKLVENCILPTTEIGDIVLDPFSGSGTTGIVAIKHNRKFILIEKDLMFYEKSIKKIEQQLQIPTQVNLF